MTHCTRPLSRETCDSYRGRPVIVSLLPGNRIEVRVKGLRTMKFETTARGLLESLAWSEAKRIAADARAAKKNRRKSR